MRSKVFVLSALILLLPLLGACAPSLAEQKLRYDHEERMAEINKNRPVILQQALPVYQGLVLPPGPAFYYGPPTYYGASWYARFCFGCRR